MSYARQANGSAGRSDRRLPAHHRDDPRHRRIYDDRLLRGVPDAKTATTVNDLRVASPGGTITRLEDRLGDLGEQRAQAVAQAVSAKSKAASRPAGDSRRASIRSRTRHLSLLLNDSLLPWAVERVHMWTTRPAPAALANSGRCPRPSRSTRSGCLGYRLSHDPASCLRPDPSRVHRADAHVCGCSPLSPHRS